MREVDDGSFWEVGLRKGFARLRVANPLSAEKMPLAIKNDVKN